MSKLENISAYLSSVFTEDWFQKFNLDSDELGELDKANFIEFIDTTLSSFLEEINISVLIGEYVSENNFVNELTKIESIVESIPVPLVQASVQELLESKLNEEFRNAIKFCLSFYLDLYNYLDLRLEKKMSKSIISFHSFNVEDQSSKTNFENIGIRFFAYNVFVVRTDISLRPDSSNFEELHNIIHKFDLPLSAKDTLAGYSLSQILRKKCCFLVAKLALRHIVDAKLQNKYFVTDGLLKKVNPVEFIKDDDEFKNWLYYAQDHYGYNQDFSMNIEERFHKSSHKDLSDLSELEIHTRIKYFKDIVPNDSISELDQISKFEMLSNGNLSKFDNYAHSICANYSINNQFSLLIDSKAPDDLINSLYNEVLKVQNKTKIKNFFPQFKYLKHLISNLDKLTKTKSLYKNITEAKNIVEKAVEIIKAYKENIEWANWNYNYVFLLPFEESKIKTSDSKVAEIFIFSSFVLPLSGEKNQSKFERYENKINGYRSAIEIFENLQGDIKEIEIIKSDLKKEFGKIEGKDIRSMEILGIFTAIVTFVAGSIQAFQFIRNPLQAFLFMLAFGTSLAVFVNLILITGKREDTKRNSVFIISFLVFSLLIWGFIIFAYFKGKEDCYNVKKPKSFYSKFFEGINEGYKDSINSKIIQDTFKKKNI